MLLMPIVPTQSWYRQILIRDHPSYILRKNRAESKQFNYKINEVFRAEDEQKSECRRNSGKSNFSRSTNDFLTQNNLKCPQSRSDSLKSQGYKISKDTELLRRNSVEFEVLPLSRNRFFTPL